MQFRTRFTSELFAHPVLDCQQYCDYSDPENEYNSLTQQHFKSECDINLIIKRHEETGLWSDSLKPPTRQPMFGDFSDVPDYQTAQDMLIDAEDMFMQLPASIRKQFDNNAMAFVDFYLDSENEEQLMEMGLLQKPEKLEPDPVLTKSPTEPE